MTTSSVIRAVALLTLALASAGWAGAAPDAGEQEPVPGADTQPSFFIHAAPRPPVEVTTRIEQHISHINELILQLREGRQKDSPYLGGAPRPRLGYRIQQAPPLEAAKDELTLAIEAYLTAGAESRDAKARYAATDGESDSYRQADQAVRHSNEKRTAASLAIRRLVAAEGETAYELSKQARRALGLGWQLERASEWGDSVEKGIHQWWRESVGLSATLARRHREFPKEAYPPSAIPPNGWQTAREEVRFVLLSPGLIEQNARTREEQESVAVAAANAYTDAVFSLIVAQGNVDYLTAAGKYAVEACAGDSSCLADLEAELLAAQAELRFALAELDTRREIASSLIQQTRGTQSFIEALSADESSVRQRLRDFDTSFDALEQRLLDTRQATIESCHRMASYFGVTLYCDQPIPVTERALSAANVGAPHFEVKDHVFTLFNDRVVEPDGFGAYTYVLFPRRDGRPDIVTDRYRKLLLAIVSTTDTLDEAVLPKDKLNLFAIPGTVQCGRGQEFTDAECQSTLSNVEAAGKLENYSVTLARKYLAYARGGEFLRPEIMGKIADSAGPFLLTTRYRLSEATNRGGFPPLLFVDLSGVNPDTYVDVVNAYKNTLIDSPPAEQLEWKPPPREWIQGFVLQMGEHIGNVNKAVFSALGFGA